jgi:BlaI family penicillinase repressor
MRRLGSAESLVRSNHPMRPDWFVAGSSSDRRGPVIERVPSAPDQTFVAETLLTSFTDVIIYACNRSRRKTMTAKSQISDAEWQVMNVVWERQPLASQEVVAALANEHDWSAATVKTMLHRLVKKRVLAFKREGNRYHYRARIGRNDCIRQAAQSFVERVFGGETAPMLAHFVRSGQLSDEEIVELKRLLDEQEAQR